MSPVRVNVHIEGLPAIQRKLRKENLIAAPLTDALTASAKEAVRIVETRAPRATGRLAGSVTYRVDKRPVPTWARVQVTARSRSKKYPRGYRYPRWLEYASNSPHQRWFRGAVIPARSALQRHVEAAKRHIERIWSR